MSNNNVQNVRFLRNGSLYQDHAAALSGIQSEFNNNITSTAFDGTAILARYGSGNNVKTLVGFIYYVGENKSLTTIDIEGAASDVQALREEINSKLGDITSANTVSNQLAQLSGDTASTSGDTSVEGAKRYADAKIGEAIADLDYTGVTTGDGVYVTNVTEADGVIAATTATLPSVEDEASAKTVVISVSEDKGEISVSKGTITSTGKTIVLTDNADGGVNFEANVDGETIIIDENTGVMSVANSALIAYNGDDDTIQVSDTAQGVKTISSLLTIQKVTTGLSEEVKEEYRLVGASGNTFGDPVKIYKDSHIVSIDYISDPADAHYQNLEYVYVNNSGITSTTYVDMSELVLEAEFESGITVTNGIVHGVVDPTSETFLTVGADGFKLSGVQNAIDAVDDDIEELSAKTVTAITSTNGSISASIDDAIGNKTYDINTDASKIKMSGFTSTDVLSGISESDSITDAFEEVDAVITANEQVISSSLNDLNNKIDTVSGDVETLSGQVQTLESSGISGITMNGTAVTVSNNVAPVVINSATSATTAATTEAITVSTDANGNVTLGLAAIDCGTY